MSASSASYLSRKEEFLFSYLPLAVLACFVLLELCFPSFSASCAGWPIVLSLIFFGMPHGAVDFLVNSRLQSASDFKDQMRTFVSYVFILLVCLTALVVAPKFALVLFVITSAMHFGLADARDIDNRSPGRSPRFVTMAAGVARGTLILSLPFAANPAASWQVFANILAIVGRDVNAVPPLLVEPVSLVACTLAVVLQTGVFAWRCTHQQTNAAIIEIVEHVTIALAFFVLHPLFAMGLYVIAWHSWRHMQPLTRFFAGDQHPHTYGEFGRSIVKLHLYSLPLLIPTLFVFAVVGWWRLETWTSEMMAALTITIFVVVTLPHHLLVEELVQHLGSSEVEDPKTVKSARDVHASLRPNSELGQ